MKNSTRTLLAIGEFFLNKVTPIFAIALLVLFAIAIVVLPVSFLASKSTPSAPSYAQQIITVGDVKWLCLTNDDKPVSCQLISPLADDKLNNYQHINVQG